MIIAKILFIAIIVVMILLIIFLFRKYLKDKRVFSVSRAFTILTGALLGILIFLIPYVFPNASNTTDVKIVSWESDYLDDNILLTMTSCTDESQVSNYSGEKPAYFVIMTAKITYTIVNYGNVPNGIINVTIPNVNDNQKGITGLPFWYIYITKQDEINKSEALPLTLPQRIPQKWVFHAYHVIETKPNADYSYINEYGFQNYIPSLLWVFTTIDNIQISHKTKLLYTSPEVVNDGNYKFLKSCIDIVPVWPIPALRDGPHE